MCWTENEGNNLGQGRDKKAHLRTAGDGEVLLAAVARFFLKGSLLSKEGAAFGKMQDAVFGNRVYF